MTGRRACCLHGCQSAQPSLPARLTWPGASCPHPQRAEAVWERQQAAQGQAPLLPTPVTQPATSLAALAACLGSVPDVSLQLLQGRQPAAAAEQATAVVMRCGHALAAVVHLQPPGSLAPLRVSVLSAAEADAALRGGAGGSLWAPSQHAVFQHLTLLAAQALQHFRAAAAAAQPEVAGASALELLLLWLATCGDVFSRSPSAGGPLLLADPAAAGQGLLPPLRRPWQLGWQALWQAALNPQLREAQHLL